MCGVPPIAPLVLGAVLPPIIYVLCPPCLFELFISYVKCAPLELSKMNALTYKKIADRVRVPFKEFHCYDVIVFDLLICFDTTENTEDLCWTVLNGLGWFVV